MHDVSGASTHWNKKHEKLCRNNQWLVSNWPGAELTYQVGAELTPPPNSPPKITRREGLFYVLLWQFDMSGQSLILIANHSFNIVVTVSIRLCPVMSNYLTPFLISPTSLHLSPSPLFSPPLPLFSFLPVSLYTVRPLITDAQTGQKKTIYKYIPQLRT